MKLFVFGLAVLACAPSLATAAPLGSANDTCSTATVISAGTHTGLQLYDHWYWEQFTHQILWSTDYDWFLISVPPGERLQAQVLVTHVVGQYSHVNADFYETDPVTCANNSIPGVGASIGVVNSTGQPKDYLLFIYVWSDLPQGDLDLDYDLVVDIHPPAVQTYCPGHVNSTGAGAVLAAHGSTSVATNNLVFTADHLPPSPPALLFDGTTQIQVPFGDGLRCVGGSQHRLVQQSTVGGVWSSALDFTTLPPGAAITPGSTRFFQLWYRNVNGPLGTGYNLTNGLQITFSP